MNMRCFLYSALVVLLSLTGIQAQTATSQPTPSSLLERAERALYRSDATMLDFTTQLKDKAGRIQSGISGKMYLQGDAFRLEYGTITAVYTAGTLTYYDSAEQTLTISTPFAEELLQINPLYFLRSRAKGYQSSLRRSTPQHATVLFTPMNTKGSITNIIAVFQQSNGLPSQLVFLAKDKSQLTAKIGRVTHRATYPSSFFQLEAKDYPGCEVVDLR